MKKRTEPMMDYCELVDTEDEAIAVCREVNRPRDERDEGRIFTFSVRKSVWGQT